MPCPVLPGSPGAHLFARSGTEAATADAIRVKGPMPDPPPAQALINSGMNPIIVRTGRIEADAPSGGRVEVSAQGALPAGASISPTQARFRALLTTCGCVDGCGQCYLSNSPGRGPAVQCGAGHMVLADLSTETSDKTAFVICICSNVCDCG